MRGGWGLRNLMRHPLRTALSLAGIAVAAAMLLDMVMLSGGIERSFAELLLSRGYQIRVTPAGTLPFDAEATIPAVTSVRDSLRADPAIAAAGAILGGSIYAHRGDSLLTLFAYGVEPEAQGIYQLVSGRDLEPGDVRGILLSSFAASALHAGVGDTVRVAGRLDPQMAGSGGDRTLDVRGIVRWLYDYRGQRSVGVALRTLQEMTGRATEDRASLLMVKVKEGADPAAVTGSLRERFPSLAINSIADLVAAFRVRMLYFRQLSYILGTVSLLVTVLLVATLLTITVNERLGEIVTLRAIGVSRGRVVRQVMAEGAVLTVIGAVLGVILGLATARYLDAILTSFPGLPAAFSFFVPRTDAIALAGATLLVTGTLAGLYPAWRAAGAPIAATLRAEAT
jgi:putative ABC transport system permease protein